MFKHWNKEGRADSFQPLPATRKKIELDFGNYEWSDFFCIIVNQLSDGLEAEMISRRHSPSPLLSRPKLCLRRYRPNLSEGFLNTSSTVSPKKGFVSVSVSLMKQKSDTKKAILCLCPCSDTLFARHEC